MGIDLVAYEIVFLTIGSASRQLVHCIYGCANHNCATPVPRHWDGIVARCTTVSEMSYARCTVQRCTAGSWGRNRRSLHSSVRDGLRSLHSTALHSSVRDGLRSLHSTALYSGVLGTESSLAAQHSAAQHSAAQQCPRWATLAAQHSAVQRGLGDGIVARCTAQRCTAVSEMGYARCTAQRCTAMPFWAQH